MRKFTVVLVTEEGVEHSVNVRANGLFEAEEMADAKLRAKGIEGDLKVKEVIDPSCLGEYFYF